MKFQRLLELVGNEPVFETSLLLAGRVSRADIMRQLSRWTKAGRLVQLRKGVYAFAEPFRKVVAHPFVVAGRLVTPSYATSESALSHHGLIPEAVPVTTSVTTGRGGRFDTPLGACAFRHLKEDLFWGYELTALGDGQQAFVATPEKALLDLVYLRREGTSLLEGMRLQGLERIDMAKLSAMVERATRPIFRRALVSIAQLQRDEAKEYDTL